MGLVLGPDGKKLKSRDGNALTANEAMSLVCENLRDTEKPNQVAWNLLAWNFLHVSRSQDVKFEVEKWVDPNSAGMHITYTHARVNKALKAAGVDTRTSRRSTIWNLVDLLPPEDLTELDIKLLGFAEQSNYWADQARKKIDMAGLANYTHDLSRLLGKAYAAEKIVGGRTAFVLSMQYANNVLADCMFWLGMFLVEEV
jgi:arginyl-tRNA synthetase